MLTVPYCHSQSPWLADYKGIVSYTLPRVDVQLAGTFQSLPGVELVGNLTATNADVQPSLGRPLSGNASTVTVNIVPPANSFGDRLNQIDLRAGKIAGSKENNESTSTLRSITPSIRMKSQRKSDVSTYLSSSWVDASGVLPTGL